MKILILGAGVVGTTYAWQLSNARQEVTLFVRQGKREAAEREGFRIRCRDERKGQATPAEIAYRPAITDKLSPQDGYDLYVVCVRAHQLDQVLPLLAERSGAADILFFSNNWWGDEKIGKLIPARRYLFGFSRLVGGWRTGNQIDCVIFNAPGLVTMLGEKDGQITPRLQKLVAAFRQADLRPETSRDILGWLAVHYVEFLGAIGGILKTGSTRAFADNPAVIKEAILATREGLRVCQARGINLARAAPINVRLVDSLPLLLLTPLVHRQYQTPSIQQFFEENITHGREELSAQYYDVLTEGRRLGVKMPYLESFEKYFAQYRNGT